LSLHIQYNHITEDDRASWAEFLTNHPENTVFQSPEMFDFYQKVNHYTPHIFLAKDDQGAILGVLLAVIIKEYSGWKGRMSSRTVVYGGPLLGKTDTQQVLKQLLESLDRELKSESVYVQFRNFIEWPLESASVFESCGFRFNDRLNLLVNTAHKEETEKAISKTKLRQIRKGMANGSIIRPPKNMGEVQVFYELLSDVYRNRVRKPLPDRSFFEQFYEISRKGKLGIIRLVLHNDTIIGGVLSPMTDNRNIYEWYVLGLDERYKKNYPSILATWAPIEYALENNLAHFDFMGLGTPLKPYGVRDFKLHFGKNTTNPGRFSKINNRFLYMITEMSYNILRVFNKV
jgi:lipid II:glycine glycyltransferase (peptidoglycan interpeptide bridge formation enzyme)